MDDMEKCECQSFPLGTKGGGGSRISDFSYMNQFFRSQSCEEEDQNIGKKRKRNKGKTKANAVVKKQTVKKEKEREKKVKVEKNLAQYKKDITISETDSTDLKKNLHNLNNFEFIRDTYLKKYAELGPTFFELDPMYSTNLTRTLQNRRKYDRLIEFIKNPDSRGMMFLVGAGISTAAGIPDFRSENGLFNQFQAVYPLISPVKIFDFDAYKEQGFSYNYYNHFIRQFAKTKYTPTVFHYFMGFLIHKNRASLIITQNFDGLERQAVQDYKDTVVYAHGNIFGVHCPNSHCTMTKIDIKEFNKKFLDENSIYECPKCKAPCKYSIVFYGENTEVEFNIKLTEIQNSRPLPPYLIIAGTSLQVPTFSDFLDELQKETKLIYVNNESCCSDADCYFSFGKKKAKEKNKSKKDKDLFCQGNCDYFALQVMRDCGFEEEFFNYVQQTKRLCRERGLDKNWG